MVTATATGRNGEFCGTVGRVSVTMTYGTDNEIQKACSGAIMHFLSCVLAPGDTLSLVLVAQG